MSDLHRLIYTSRTALPGGAEERRAVDGILAASRRNNGRDGITGALLLGAGAFAQVLEGPRTAVEAAFERIRRDPRHADVAVLQRGPVPARSFPGAALAFAGPAEGGWRLPPSLARLDGDGFCAAVLALLRAPGSAGRDGSAPQADGSAPAFPAPRAKPEDAPSAEGSVLRAALGEERGRVTALRRELDEARVALARAAGEVEALARHRDIWADRSSQLRTGLRDEREARRAAEAERDALRERLAAQDGDLGRLRHHLDIWSERARAVVAGLCREPGEQADEAPAGPALPAQARERLRAAG